MWTRGNSKKINPFRGTAVERKRPKRRVFRLLLQNSVLATAPTWRFACASAFRSRREAATGKARSPMVAYHLVDIVHEKRSYFSINLSSVTRFNQHRESRWLTQDFRIGDVKWWGLRAVTPFRIGLSCRDGNESSFVSHARPMAIAPFNPTLELGGAWHGDTRHPSCRSCQQKIMDKNYPPPSMIKGLIEWASSLLMYI